MSVESVSSRAGDMIAVVLKCTSMNKAISSLRKEEAQITVKTYTGLRISNEALTADENGTEGVYTLSGKRITFKPIDIMLLPAESISSAKTRFRSSFQRRNILSLKTAVFTLSVTFKQIKSDKLSAGSI